MDVLPLAENGTFTCNQPPPYKTNQKAKLKCHAGFSSQHTFSKVVEKNGVFTWDPPAVTCQAVSCNEPPYLENGYHLGKMYFFPNKITYYCNEGYIFTGKPSSQFCGAGGNWTPRFIDARCEPVRCPELKNPTNGSVTYENRNFHSVARYACDPGFKMSGGDGKRKCLGDGNWSGEDITCLKNSCPELSDALKFRYKSDDLIIIDCNGTDTTIKCTDGEWSKPPSNCPSLTIFPENKSDHLNVNPDSLKKSLFKNNASHFCLVVNFLGGIIFVMLLIFLFKYIR